MLKFKIYINNIIFLYYLSFISDVSFIMIFINVNLQYNLQGCYLLSSFEYETSHLTQS